MFDIFISLASLLIIIKSDNFELFFNCHNVSKEQRLFDLPMPIVPFAKIQSVDLLCFKSHLSDQQE